MKGAALLGELGTDWKIMLEHLKGVLFGVHWNSKVVLQATSRHHVSRLLRWWPQLRGTMDLHHCCLKWISKCNSIIEGHWCDNVIRGNCCEPTVSDLGSHCCNNVFQQRPRVMRVA
jgi:hypothetical protein